MANYNLTTQSISSSFQQLMQHDTDTNVVYDGTGSQITELDVSASYASNGGVTSIIAGTNISINQSQGDVTISASGGGGTTDTGSLLVTSSVVDATITFTKGDSSTFDITIDNVQTAVSSSVAVSASHAEVADLANLATSAIGATNTDVQVKNLEATEIAKGTPLYFTDSGTSGNIVGAYRADASNPSRMPAAGIAGETIAAGAEGQAFLDGYIGGVDTSLFGAGDSIYVAPGGGYQNSRPTGSNILVQAIGYVAKSAVNGSGVIQGSGRTNDVPNIQQGYGWFGNGDGVAIATSTGSFAKTDINNTFTGTQNFTNISVSGTGSFAYLESITGSAKIIGDAFIVLNNNTPTERYAGVAVYDSGSAGVTASFQFDGLNNDWFYEYSDDGGATTDHGVALFGPEYATKGTPTYPTNNTIQKGTGGHHLSDSNITDTGTLISLGSNTTITGNLEMTGAGQIINIANGIVEANEVAGDTMFVNSLQPNTAPSVGVNSSLNVNFDVTASAMTLSGNLDMTSTGNQILNIANGIVEANEVAGDTMFVNTIQANTAAAVTLDTDIVISGSVSNKVSSQGITSLTASIDFSDTSLFELTLGSGVDTHIDATNIGKGQTVNILITQNASSAGTVSFSPKFLQPSGSEYTPTTTLSGQDILTLITYSDTSKIYVANVNKFI